MIIKIVKSGLTALLLISFFETLALPIKSIRVGDFGIMPDLKKDQSNEIRTLFQYCREHKIKKVVFEPGRYDFWPEYATNRPYYISNTSSEAEIKDKTKHIGLLIEDQSDLEIIAGGALFVFHGKMTPFAIVNSRDVTIKGLSIDFERPTMSEFTVVEMSKDSMLVQVHKDSKYRIVDKHVQWYGHNWTADRYMMHAVILDPKSQECRYADYQAILRASVSEKGPQQLLFKGDFSKIYPPGAVMSVRNTIREEVGGFVYRSKNVILEGLKIHYMHGLGITSQFSENLHYKNILIEPSNERTVAAFADALHFSGCKGNILIDGCRFSGMHDDPINVHGTYLQVKQKLAADELIVEFKHHQSYGFDAFQVGDSVQFVDRNTIIPVGAGAKILAVSQLSLTEIRLKIDRPIAERVSLGDALENVTWNPAVTIRNCRFTGTNTRGLLISTPKKVLIEKNNFFKTGMHAILIAADVNSWYESGAVEDVLIQKNSFISCGYNQPGFSYPIAILPEVKKTENGKYVHRNIRIVKNRFDMLTDQVLFAKSVDGLLFGGNTMNISKNKYPQKVNIAIDKARAFTMEQSNNIKILNNQANFNWLTPPK